MMNRSLIIVFWFKFVLCLLLSQGYGCHFWASDSLFRSSICSTSLDSSTTFPFTMVWVTTLTIFLVLTSGSSTEGKKKKNNAKTKRHDNLCKFSVLNLNYWTTQVVLLLPLIYGAELLSKSCVVKKTTTFWKLSLIRRMCCHIIWGKLSQRKPAIKQPFSKIHDKILETANILNVMYNHSNKCYTSSYKSNFCFSQEQYLRKNVYLLNNLTQLDILG